MIDRITELIEDPENEKSYYVLHYKAKRMSEAVHSKRWYSQKSKVTIVFELLF